MWGAIIQAIDHAAGRLKEGGKAGIDVADSQHGGAANSSQDMIDTSKAGESTEKVADTAKDTAGSNATSTGTEKGDGESGGLGSFGAGAIGGAGVGAGIGGGGTEGVGGALSSIASDERLKAKEKASAVVKKWHNRDKVISDENAKNARKTGTMQKAKKYSANAANGFVEAGRVATGQSSGGQPVQIEMEDQSGSVEDNYKEKLKRNQQAAAEAVR